MKLRWQQNYGDVFQPEQTITIGGVHLTFTFTFTHTHTHSEGHICSCTIKIESNQGLISFKIESHRIHVLLFQFYLAPSKQCFNWSVATTPIEIPPLPTTLSKGGEWEKKGD